MMITKDSNNYDNSEVYHYKNDLTNDQGGYVADDANNDDKR